MTAAFVSSRKRSALLMPARAIRVSGQRRAPARNVGSRQTARAIAIRPPTTDPVDEQDDADHDQDDREREHEDRWTEPEVARLGVLDVDRDVAGLDGRRIGAPPT